MTFHTATMTPVDPVAEIVFPRVALRRRMLFKHPSLRKRVEDIYDIYASRNEHGIATDANIVGALAAAPYPGKDSQAALPNPAGKPRGMIPLLLQSLRDYCMGMFKQLLIGDSNFLALDILQTPFQHVKPMLHSSAMQVRCKLAATTRAD